MNDSTRYSEWKRIEDGERAGFDFSMFGDEVVWTPLPWSYPDIVRAAMRRSTAVLDLDTGAGAFLFSLREDWPATVKATEAWKPSLLKARQLLKETNAEVAEARSASGEPLPFESKTFDLVINRHGGMNCPEIFRVLRSGGSFISQHVDGFSGQDLIEFIAGKLPDWAHMKTLDRDRKRLEVVGFAIKRSEYFEGKKTFKDVSAVVKYFLACPWLIEGFTVDRYRPQLEQLHQRWVATGPLEFVDRHYLIEATKA